MGNPRPQGVWVKGMLAGKVAGVQGLWGLKLGTRY